MDGKKQSIVVIPAYKPGQALVKTAREVTDAGYRLLVVDDGSGEGYESVWNELSRLKRVRVIRHTDNRGKGAALKTAFGYIADCYPATGYVVTMDADGQHLTGDMENVLATSWDDPGKLVLGTRTFGKDTPVKSLIGNKVTAAVFKAVCGTGVGDTQTGLRAFGRSLLDEMRSIEGDRYEYEMNVLMYCGKNGIEMKEVPITTVYNDSRNSGSHFHPIRDAVRIYRNIFRFAGSSLISFAADYLLFLILLPLTGGHVYGVLTANALARVFSAGLNYSINTKAVFRDGRPVRETLPKYAALALAVLAANTIVLTTLVNGIGIAPQAAKIITEIVMFAFSYTIQSCLIFKPVEKPDMDEHLDVYRLRETAVRNDKRDVLGMREAA